MGGKKRDQDEDAEERPHGLAGSHLDPDKRPRLSATSRTRTTSETIDLGAVTRAVGEAYDKGASSMRLNCENLQRANAELFGQLSAANATIANLNGQIAQYAGQDPTLAFLRYQADRDRLDREKEKDEDAHKWQTIREVLPEAVKALGPAAGPLAAWGAQKLGIALLPPAPKDGDKSPRAVTQRLVARLQDGSEKSVMMLGILREFVEEGGEGEFPLVLSFLVEAITPKASEEAAS